MAETYGHSEKHFFKSLTYFKIQDELLIFMYFKIVG